MAKPLSISILKRERSQSFESAATAQEAGAYELSAVEAAEMLYSLKGAQRERAQGLGAPCRAVDTLAQPEEWSLSSSGSACSVPMKFPCKALTATSKQKPIAPLATRSYVWRGPKRSQVLSSDPDEEDDSGIAGPRHLAAPALAPAAPPVGSISDAASGERSERDKEWAALTTWLRMNLHHPRTAKREVLFLGQHVLDRGWHFFLNPALCWDDVSPETKMRLRTLPQETELAFMRKYPGRPGRDWVNKTQKYRPPGCSVTYAVPLADMIYSLTAIFYRFEGRPGTGMGTAAGGSRSNPLGPYTGARGGLQEAGSDDG